MSTLLFYAYILTRLACEQCKSGSCVEKIASVFHALICDGFFFKSLIYNKLIKSQTLVKNNQPHEPTHSNLSCPVQLH